MPEIKLYICCHKPCDFPKHELLTPIQVGAALADELLPGVLYDNSGDNISALNRSYCELTAQYWAWKNSDADYLGFFHYRRYLYPDLKEKRPYRIYRRATDHLLAELGFDSFPKIIPQYDLILPRGEHMHTSVCKHYEDAPYHRIKDLKLMVEILLDHYPDYERAADSYLNGDLHYFGNLYIMKREVFLAYCNWLFPLLSEFDERIDKTDYSGQELRVDGFIAERMFGIYYTHHRTNLQTTELPVAFFEPDRREYWKKQSRDFFLRPNSRSRAQAKRILTAYRRIQNRHAKKRAGTDV